MKFNMISENGMPPIFNQVTSDTPPNMAELAAHLNPDDMYSLFQQDEMNDVQAALRMNTGAINPAGLMNPQMLQQNISSNPYMNLEGGLDYSAIRGGS